MFNPIKLPMIVEPTPWENNKVGGYLLEEFNGLV